MAYGRAGILITCALPKPVLTAKLRVHGELQGCQDKGPALFSRQGRFHGLHQSSGRSCTVATAQLHWHWEAACSSVARARFVSQHAWYL